MLWDSAFSDAIRLQCGVRQGGVLSPVLFSVYVNVVIMALSVSAMVMDAIAISICMLTISCSCLHHCVICS